MTLLRTFRWLIAIVAVLIIVVGVGAWWFWLRSDEMIRTGIVEHFAKVAPEWDLSCRSTRFDGGQRVHCYSIELKPRSHTAQLIRIPELVVTIDRNRFLFEQQIDIQQIEFNNPEINITRSVDGRWNWQDLAQPKKSKNRMSPEIHVNGATVHIKVEKNGQPPTQVTVHDADVQLIPDAMQLYDVKGFARLPDESSIDVNGWLDVQKKTWKVGGSLERLMASGTLLELAMSSPELQNSLQKYGLMNSRPTSSDPVMVAALPDALKLRNPPLQLKGTPIDQLGLSGTIGVEFDVRRTNPENPAAFRLGVNVQQGQLDNPVLPFPLRNVNGKFFWENDRLIIEDCSAQNGRSRFEVNASIITKKPGAEFIVPDGLPQYVRFHVENLHVEPGLRRVLPPSLKRQFDGLRPEGDLNATGQLMKLPDGNWVASGIRVDVKNGRVNPLKFQYPAENITGTILQRDSQPMLDLDLHGLASGQPIQITGTVLNPGPAAESTIRISAPNIPIDRTFREALDDKGRKVLDSLRLTGVCDANVVLYRPPGIGRKTLPTIDAHVRDARMQYVKFPWVIEDIEGNLHYDPVRKQWSLRDLIGMHNDAQVAVTGAFHKLNDPGRLNLTFEVTHGAFDKDLRYALTDNLKRAWNELSPTGRFDMKMNLDWIAERNSVPVVRIESMNIPSQIAERSGRYSDNTLRLRAFPWTMTGVKAALSYDPGREPQVDVSRFVASHNQVRVSTKAGFDQYADEGWRLKLADFEAVNAVADRDLLSALPQSLRVMLQTLRPTRPFQIRKSSIALGQPRAGAVVQSQWNSVFELSGGDVTAGVTLNNISGRVSANGSWDGRRLRNVGRFQFANLEYLGNRLQNVRGPYSSTESRLVVGSATALGNNRNSVSADQRVQADAYGGRFTLDGVIPLDGRTRYQLLAVLSNAQLQQWSKQHNLSGTTNGWISLTGIGSDQRTMSGQGQITVSPAKLYELPVILQVLESLSRPDLFGRAKRAAFDNATAKFRVGNRQFNFEPIHLTGSSLSLKGKGSVGFDGQLALNFYSHQARRQSNIISALVQEAARGWVGVYVRGNVNAPRTQVETGVPVNDFLRSFSPPRQSGLSIPSLFVPQTARSGQNSSR